MNTHFNKLIDSQAIIVKAAMLIYMVHGTFFQELTREGRVTEQAVAREDLI